MESDVKVSRIPERTCRRAFVTKEHAGQGCVGNDTAIGHPCDGLHLLSSSLWESLLSSSLWESHEQRHDPQDIAHVADLCSKKNGWQ